ncbi:DUF5633 domain-containing protein [Anaerococcus vaginimassiliensis]|uniref:DUF5633 domain-containing protein n=1 Tax=Anaerococcus vaginimassiliensis TaxID=2042308 RepID=UPI001031DBF9|nr:DUF5633 domain-containing protein [Anaerococcus vaginimassiliensis]
MKRNKIAAGALALALGFGAVAPVHAAEDNPSSESIKDLINEMRNERENLDSNSEKIMDALGRAQEIERERQRAAQEGGSTVEGNDSTGETTPSDNKDNSETDKNGSSSSQSSAGKKDTETTDDGSDGGSLDLSPAGDTNNLGAGAGKQGSTGNNNQSGKEKDDKNKGKKDKKVYDLADNEEKGYDTKADAIAAAKQALADKEFNKAGNNSYEVAKNENNGKWFFKLVIDTDKAIAEENKEDKKEGKKDNKSQAPARKADSNAQTGVAGLVSVASILGAASVAYVASKKRD